MAVSKSKGPNSTNPNDPNNPNNPDKTAMAYDPKDPNLAAYDVDKDGKIDYDEWSAMPEEMKNQYELDMNYKKGEYGFYKKKGTKSEVVN
jgi:hypothetical protein